MRDFGAHIDLRSFMCELASMDLASSHEIMAQFGDEISRKGSEILQDFLKFGINVHSKLPDKLYEAAGKQLFHERLHYWQLIGYPILQWRFILGLERLRCKLAAAGSTRTYALAGLTVGPNTWDLDKVEGSIQLLDAQIRTTPALIVESESNVITLGKYAIEQGMLAC